MNHINSDLSAFAVLYALLTPLERASVQLAERMQRAAAAETQLKKDASMSKARARDGVTYFTATIRTKRIAPNAKLQSNDLPIAIRYSPQKDRAFVAAVEGRVDEALAETFSDYDPSRYPTMEEWVVQPGVARRLSLVIAGACISDSTDLLRGLFAELPTLVTARLLVLCEADFVYADQALGSSPWKRLNRATPSALFIAALTGNSAPFRLLLRALFQFDQQRERWASQPFAQSPLYAHLFINSITTAHFTLVRCLLATNQVSALKWILQLVREYNGGRDVEMMRTSMMQTAVEVDSTEALEFLMREGEVSTLTLNLLIRAAQRTDIPQCRTLELIRQRKERDLASRTMDATNVV